MQRGDAHGATTAVPAWMSRFPDPERQGISYSVPVLALSPFRPASMGPHSAHDGSTVVCSRGQTPYARVPKPRTLRSTPGTPAII